MLNRIDSLISSLKHLELLKPELKKAFHIILESIQSGGTIYTAGNGGSSSCASHLMEELVGRYKETRPPIKSICFSSSSDLLSCIANDFKYKNVFSRQVECFCKKEDVLILFTSSGNSKNLIQAIETALKKEIQIVIFTGKDGGEINQKYKDLINQIIIKNEDSGIIQEVHLHLIHELVEYLEKNLYRP